MKTVKIIILIGIFLLLSCTNGKEKHKELINKLEEFKRTNHKYPEKLSEIEMPDNRYCYYLTDNSFNLEFVSYGDLYWYNSGNGFWDYLEGDAEKYHCN